MTKYRKLPVVIEAVQYDGTLKSIGSLNIPEVCQYFMSDELIIHTLEGEMMVKRGDYIIKGIAGEFYPCKEAIFLATYEKVEE